MNTKTLFAFFGSAALAVTAACDPQADPDYQGEPLATLSGTMYSDSASASENLQIFLSWYYDDGEGDKSAAEPVDVTGGFPLNFTLDLYEPPANEVMIDLSQEDGATGNEARIAIAYIAAAPDLNAEFVRGWLGLVEKHMLLYVEGEIVEGSLGAEWLGGTAKAGYHLLRFLEPGQEDCPADYEFDCARVMNGVDQDLEMRIVSDFNEFEIPSWF